MTSCPVLCGSAGGVDEHALTFEPCCRFVDEWLTATEPEIGRMMTEAVAHHDERLEGDAAKLLCSSLCTDATSQAQHVCSAGSAGVAIACYAKHRDAGLVAGRTCVIVCCGGNVSDATLRKAEALSRGLPSL